MRKFFVVLFFRLMIFANGKRRYIDTSAQIGDVLFLLNRKVKEAIVDVDETDSEKIITAKANLDKINLASSKLREAQKILNESVFVVIDRN